MLVEFLNVISVDKKLFAENLRLNIQPETHQLRLKVTYISEEQKTPVDIVVFKWTPKLEKLNMAMVIDGKEMTTNTNFLLKLSYDIFKRQLKLSGNIAGNDVKVNITNMQDFLEIPKQISFPCFKNLKH